MTRAFSVTVRSPDGAPLVDAVVCVNDRCGHTDASGRVRIDGISTDWHQVELRADADGYVTSSESVNIDPTLTPPFVDVEWPDLLLQPMHQPGGPLAIDGDHFTQAGVRFLVRGATEFRLTEVLLTGGDIQPILQDRRDAGCNWLRILGLKKNNTGWSLSHRTPGYWQAVRDTFAQTAAAGFAVEWVVFADTLAMMPDPGEQQDHYAQTCEVARAYPHVLLELVNEAGHATQKIDPQRFSRPSGVLASHGSGLSDVQPVKPLWDYATYHARRSGSIGKMLSNYSPYVFQDTFPTPCPYVPEESIKPQQYGHDTRVAECMGEHARCGAGGTFHGDWWNEPRLFTDGERACAISFYAALMMA
jgi:hypothetical protein